MYGNNTFDAAAAFSGAGFIKPSQSTQTGDTSLAPAKNRETQTLLPLTVKQISEAASPPSNDKTSFMIDGVDVNTVRMVGLLLQKDATMAGPVTFVLDDGTGRIDCVRWVNGASDSNEMELLSDGMYVKVHGHLKMGFQEAKKFSVYNARRVTDYDEIANHFADCMYVHNYNTRTRKMKDTSQATGQMSNAAVRTPSKGYQPTQSNNFYALPRLDVVQGVDKLVFNYLQQPKYLDHPLGSHRDEIAKQLNLPLDKILQAIEYLESECLIFSTNEFYYKSATNG